MDVSVRDLPNLMPRVVEAVRAGERVTLTVRGEAVADIVPRDRRPGWLFGSKLRSELSDRAADPGLANVLDGFAGQRLDRL